MINKWCNSEFSMRAQSFNHAWRKSESTKESWDYSTKISFFFSMEIIHEGNIFHRIVYNSRRKVLTKMDMFAVACLYSVWASSSVRHVTEKIARILATIRSIPASSENGSPLKCIFIKIYSRKSLHDGNENSIGIYFNGEPASVSSVERLLCTIPSFVATKVFVVL